MAVYCLVMTKIQCMCNVQFTGEFACARSLNQLYYFVVFFSEEKSKLSGICLSFLIVFKNFLHFIFGIPIRSFGRLKRSIPNRITSMQIVSFHCRLSNFFFFKTETETEKAQAPVWYDIYRYIYLYVCKSKCKINWQTFWTRAVTRSTLDMLW